MRVFQRGKSESEAIQPPLGKPVVLIVDDHVPFFDRDAGSRRIAHLLDALLARGRSVVFGSLDRDEYPPYANRLREAGVYVALGFNRVLMRELVERGVVFEAVWLSRPSSASLLIDAVREVVPRARIFYDTVDLHYRRLERQESATGKPTSWRAMRERELALARSADCAIVTSDIEAEELRARGVARVGRFGVFEMPIESVAPWEERSGGIFIGNYAHVPNVDAACEMVRAILPLVREEASDFSMVLAGADPTASVRKLAGSCVEVPGYVADLSALLARRRVFAAPLRFGAGLKGKLVQALANGMPVVTTAIGAEGLPNVADWGIIAEDAPAFARALVRVHEDRALWERLSAGALRTAERFTPRAAISALDGLLF